MQRLEVSGAVRPIYGSLGVKRLTNWEECGAVSRLCELHPGICLTTEDTAWKHLSQGSRRVPVGTMKTEHTEQSIRNNKNS